MATPPDPAKLLRWIIKETATPNYNNDNNNPNSKPPTKKNNDSNNKDDIPVQRLADLDEEEKKKWTGIIQHLISGQSRDMLNNRASLQQAIERLHQIKNNVSNPTIINGGDKKEQKKDDKDNDNDKNEEEEELGGNKEIKACLSIIHTLLDKNEAVLAKLNGIPLLFELIQSSIDIDNEITLDCCTIIHDATQNNPMMQNHIYSHNGIPIVLKTLQNCKKTNYRIRAKLWALIHVISRDHNPNFNLFLTNGGYQEINRILRIEQSSSVPSVPCNPFKSHFDDIFHSSMHSETKNKNKNTNTTDINDELLKEILRVARLINYMLGTWSDGNAKVFEILDTLKSVNWSIFTLHQYVIRLVSVNPNQQNNAIAIMNRMRTAQMILDIIMELTNGIRMFMKRDDKCKKFVIGNKNNKDIAPKLKQLQKDLGDYCSTHRPNLKLEERTKNGKPYRFKYYTTKNDDDIDKDEKGLAGLDVIDETKEEKKKNDDGDDMDSGEQIYLAMKDIWNIISSILRHVKRYEDHCEQQRKLREIWKRTTKKGQHFAKKEKLLKQQKASKLASSPTPSSLSPPPIHQYQMVLYKKNKNDEDETKNDHQSTKNNNNNHNNHRQNRRSPHKNKKHHNHKKKRQKK